MIESDNGNVHRAAAEIIVFKSRAARGSVCNVLLSDGLPLGLGLKCVRFSALRVHQWDSLPWEDVNQEKSSEHVSALLLELRNRLASK